MEHMKVRDYFKRLRPSDEVTFIKARARKDAHTPFYHAEYQTTPIWCVEDWDSENNNKILNSVVLNDRQMPIDWLSGAMWGELVKLGRLKCLLIISEEDFELLYSKSQRDSMEHFIEGKIQ